MYLPLHPLNPRAECHNPPRVSSSLLHTLCCLWCPLPHFHCLVLEQHGFLDSGFIHVFNSVRARSLGTLNAPSGFKAALFGGGTCWDSFRKSLMASFGCSGNQPRVLSCGTCRNECPASHLFRGLPGRVRAEGRRWAGSLWQVKSLGLLLWGSISSLDLEGRFHNGAS